MSGRDLEVDVYEFLQGIQLEQFYEMINSKLHLTRLSHFDHVTENDLNDVNMSKPEQRRLFDAIKKHKKEKKKASKLRFSFRRSKKKESLQTGNDASVVNLVESKSCLIDENSLKLLGELGDGAFGVVTKGEWTPNKGSKIPVAVKCLKYSKNDAFLQAQDNFMREASAMSNLDHPNVIRLHGIVLATPIKLVMELASLGSLHYRLRTEPEKFLITTLFDFVLQIASGMSYLESKRYVHRDLAARNILLHSYDKVKIGDFGLMRQLQTEEDVYVMDDYGKIAVAWCAPECLKNRQFSHASDVWAFGITVIEMFSYGKQPWEGLNGPQILEIIDEPANGRPGKPDHCPDKLYSLLIEHCWDPNPKDRGKFSTVHKRLVEVTPEDVTCFLDLENDKDPDNLHAISGDLITIVTWKSRLGTQYAKGQNKRTGQVGYFLISQVIQNTLKRHGSLLRKRLMKAKDISPPLKDSFTHCAHRGLGDMPNWGTIDCNKSKVTRAQHPLHLPTKFISLNNSDGTDKNGDNFDSSSLLSRDSLNETKNWSDSGYYSNRDTQMSQDYEPMNASNPNGIPEENPQGPQVSQCVDPSKTLLPSCQHPPDPSEVTTGSNPCPVLPAEIGVVEHHTVKRENVYENIPEATGPYEDMQGASTSGSHGSYVIPQDCEEQYVIPPKVTQDDYVISQVPVTPLVNVIPSSPSISSYPENIYVNDVRSNRRSSISVVSVDYSIYDKPIITSKYERTMRNGRCYSFPEFDWRQKFKERENNRNRFSLEKTVALNSLNESRSAPVLDRGPEIDGGNFEIASVQTDDEIYENIDIYDVPPNAQLDSPPPLPFKRCNSQKRQSGYSHRSSYSSVNSQRLGLSGQLFEEYYSRPVSQDFAEAFDSHLYAEISENFIKHLSSEYEESLSGADVLSEDSFTEISKDYADLDTIYDKLRGDKGKDAAAVNEYDKEVAENGEILWRRFSSDTRRIETRRSKRYSGNSANSLDRHPSSRSGSHRSLDRTPSSRSGSRRTSKASIDNPVNLVCNDSVQPVGNACPGLVTTV